jgi:predicted AlkP superfamily pyrophosphatase or phosphodiesterase
MAEAHHEETRRQTIGTGGAVRRTWTEPSGPAVWVALAVVVAAVVATVSAIRAPQVARAPSGRPSLLVLLVVDQFRADYVDKFESQWTGGLHRLLSEGAVFPAAAYPYADTVTCAGHATIGTGAYPDVHGMILNEWYERTRGAVVACASDPAAQVVSYGPPLTGAGESAHRLRTPTLGDELRAQLDPPARVASFSLKARAAVTLAGQRADAIAWFDDRGAWVSSTAYAPRPVAAVADYVRGHPLAPPGTVWDRTLPETAYRYESPAIGLTPPAGATAAFPHPLGATADPSFYTRWQSSPFADDYLGGLALGVVDALHLGSGRSTDLLAISFSTLDKVGHDYGPNSHEIQDVLVRLDRTLGTLFDGLDRTIGRSRYTVALSADHGVSPIPERQRRFGLDAGRVKEDALRAAVDAALVPALGAGHYVVSLQGADVYLTPAAAQRMAASQALAARVKAALAHVPGVLTAYTRTEIEDPRLRADPVIAQIALGHDPERSGDISVVLRPYWMTAGTGTTHGTGYAFDRRVPLVFMGDGIRPGIYTADASPADIAPTLARLAGVTLPRAQGHARFEALVPPFGATVGPNDVP